MNIIALTGLKRILETRRILKGDRDIQEELKFEKRKEERKVERKREERQSRKVIPQRGVILKRDIIPTGVYKMPAESFTEPCRAIFLSSEYINPYPLQIGWILCCFWLYWDRMGNVLDPCHSQIFGNKALGSYAPHPIPFQVMAIEVCDKMHLNAQYPATTWKKYEIERRLNDKVIY